MWKEPRFWITITMVAGIVVLGAMGKLQSEAIATFFAGLLARLGTDKLTSKVDR